MTSFGFEEDSKGIQMGEKNHQIKIRHGKLGGIYLYNQNFQRNIEKGQFGIHGSKKYKNINNLRQQEIDYTSCPSSDRNRIQNENIDWYIKQFLSQKERFLQNIENQKGQFTQEITDIIENFKKSERQICSFLSCFRSSNLQPNLLEFLTFEQLILSIVKNKDDRYKIYFKKLYDKMREHFNLAVNEGNNLGMKKRYQEILGVSCQTDEDLPKIINQLKKELIRKQFEYKTLYSFKKQIIVNAEEIEYQYAADIQQKIQMINKMMAEVALKNKEILYLKNMLKENQAKISKMIKKIIQRQQKYELLQANQIKEIPKDNLPNDERINQLSTKKQKHRKVSDNILSCIKQLSNNSGALRNILYQYPFQVEVNENIEKKQEVLFQNPLLANLNLFQIKQKVRNESNSNMSNSSNSSIQEKQQLSVFLQSKMSKKSIKYHDKAPRYSSQFDPKPTKAKAQLTRVSFQKSRQLFYLNQNNAHSKPNSIEKNKIPNNSQQEQKMSKRQSRIIKKVIQLQKKQQFSSIFNRQESKSQEQFSLKAKNIKNQKQQITHHQKLNYMDDRYSEIVTNTINKNRKGLQNTRKIQQMQEKKERMCIINDVINCKIVSKNKSITFQANKRNNEVKLVQINNNNINPRKQKKYSKKQMNKSQFHSIYEGFKHNSVANSPSRFSQHVSTSNFKFKTKRTHLRSTFQGYQNQSKTQQLERQSSIIKRLAEKCLTKTEYLKQILKYHKGCESQNCEHIKRYIEYFNTLKSKSTKKAITLSISNIHNNIY